MKTKFIIDILRDFHFRILLENVYQRNISPEICISEKDCCLYRKLKDNEQYANLIADRIDLLLSMLRESDRVLNLKERWIEIQKLTKSSFALHQTRQDFNDLSNYVSQFSDDYLSHLSDGIKIIIDDLKKVSIRLKLHFVKI